MSESEIVNRQPSITAIVLSRTALVSSCFSVFQNPLSIRYTHTCLPYIKETLLMSTCTGAKGGGVFVAYLGDELKGYFPF